MQGKILVIKKGASGDVIRTSTLLHFIKGNITWVTHSYNKVFLPHHHNSLKRILSFEETGVLSNEKFDIVISLDDDDECATLATSIHSNEIIGVYKEKERVSYTPHLREWFHMSLISEHGRQLADEIKLHNRKTFQEMLFEGFNMKFNNTHGYLMNESIRANTVAKRIGIEKRAGERWPTKSWNRFDELVEILKAKGYSIFFFEQRNNILDYINDVSSCQYIFTGDTLTMHLALYLKIPNVTVFTCTSPWEIAGYGIMRKVISPNLAKAFYKTRYIPEAVESITIDDMVIAFEDLVAGKNLE
jgi:heptosyltransferase-2